MLVGGITLLSAATLAGFDVLTVQCDSLTPGSMPRWLPSAWFNKLAVDCMTGYPDGVVIDLTGNFLLLTVLLFVAIPTLRRGIAATQAGSLRAALWHTGADMPLVVNTSVDDRGRQPSPRSSRSDEPSTRSIRTSMTTRRGFTRGVR
jgi:hypothetical protein